MTRTGPAMAARHSWPGVALACAGLLLATTASAQILPTGSPAVDILLSQALAEQRFFQTCTALDPATHAGIVGVWETDVARAVEILTAAQVPPEAIAAFTAAARPETLLLPPDTPFENLRRFCAAEPDWIARLNRMQVINLSRDLPKLLPGLLP